MSVYRLAPLARLPLLRRPAGRMPELGPSVVPFRFRITGNLITVDVFAFPVNTHGFDGNMLRLMLDVIENAPSEAIRIGAYLTYWLLFANPGERLNEYVTEMLDTTDYRANIHSRLTWEDAYQDMRKFWETPNIPDKLGGVCTNFNRADAAAFLGLMFLSMGHDVGSSFDQWIGKHGRQLKNAGGGHRPDHEYRISESTYRTAGRLFTQSIAMRRAAFHIIREAMPPRIRESMIDILQFCQVSYVRIIAEHLWCKGRPHPVVFLPPCEREVYAFATCLKELHDSGEDPRFARLLANSEKFTINSRKVQFLTLAAVVIGSQTNPSLNNYANTLTASEGMQVFATRVRLIHKKCLERGTLQSERPASVDQVPLNEFCAKLKEIEKLVTELEKLSSAPMCDADAD